MGRSSLERAWRTIRRHGHKCKNLRCRQTVALIGSALIQFSVGTITSLGQFLMKLSVLGVRNTRNYCMRHARVSIKFKGIFLMKIMSFVVQSKLC